MDFAERFNTVIINHGMDKKKLSRLLGIPYSTFLYKASHETAWNIVDFRNLIRVMNLSAEEAAFLFP